MKKNNIFLHNENGVTQLKINADILQLNVYGRDFAKTNCKE